MELSDHCGLWIELTLERHVERDGSKSDDEIAQECQYEDDIMSLLDAVANALESKP